MREHLLEACRLLAFQVSNGSLDNATQLCSALPICTGRHLAGSAKNSDGRFFSFLLYLLPSVMLMTLPLFHVYTFFGLIEISSPFLTGGGLRPFHSNLAETTIILPIQECKWKSLNFNPTQSQERSFLSFLWSFIY